jgi:flagellar biosynthetic protein FliR
VTFQFDPVVLTAFALALVRAAAWLFFSPPFNTRMIPTSVKAGIAASFALCAAPRIAAAGDVPTSTAGFLGALLTQVLIGVSLGLLTTVLVNALQAAGSLVDLFAGFSLAATYDPINGSQVAIFGRFYELLAITILFTSNAYLILVSGWFRSFEVVPASGLEITDIADMFTKNLGQFFIAAIEVAGPVLACLFLSELMLGVLSRAAPSLNVFSLAFPLRVLIALIVVGLALPLIGPAIGNLVNDAVAPLGTAIAPLGTG